MNRLRLPLRTAPRLTHRVARRIDLSVLPVLALVGCLLCVVGTTSADDAVRDLKRSFNTFFVTRSLAHDRLIPYLKEARPDIVQIGNYGAMFHGYADNEKSTGWPMQLPVAGERAALKYQRELNDEVHRLGLTVVGHFRLIKVMGNWDEQSGFVQYYRNNWPTDLLGPKPQADVAELLQRDAAGRPIQLGRYNQSQLALCLSSPHTCDMLKRMLKVAVDHGVDGVNTNFNYRFGCVCPYCQDAFRRWLCSHYSEEELAEKYGIEDVNNHVFTTIAARIPGYPDVTAASELDWLAARWGAEHFKQKFDDIFIEYGRSLNPGFLVAQWNHLGHVGVNEERALLPQELWGRGEDYFWYSGGSAFVGKNLSLQDGKAGDAWLSCLYVREMSGGKPFVIGKYDRTRMAVSMAEGFATGGLGMGRYMRFEDPVGFEVLARYTNFVHEHQDLYRNSKSRADVALVLPRQSVLNRRPDTLDTFRRLGQELVEQQVFIDVLVDEKITAQRLAQYQAVILPRVVAVSDDQLTALQNFAKGGKAVFQHGEFASLDERGDERHNGAVSPVVVLNSDDIESVAASIQTHLSTNGGASIRAPWTVRAAAYHQSDRLILHLVNYDREPEAPENNRAGPGDERPKPVENIQVRLPLSGRFRAVSVRLHSPERANPIDLPFVSRSGTVTFTVPQLRVYGVAAIAMDAE